MITANTKVHNHRRRVDMILFRVRSLYRNVTIRERGDAVFFFFSSAFRVLLRAAIYFGDVPRIATGRSHFISRRKKSVPPLFRIRRPVRHVRAWKKNDAN